jgi:hypothetical protein
MCRCWWREPRNRVKPCAQTFGRHSNKYSFPAAAESASLCCRCSRPLCCGTRRGRAAAAACGLASGWHVPAFCIQAEVAQLVEQLIRNQQVTGSSPVFGSPLKNGKHPARLAEFVLHIALQIRENFSRIGIGGPIDLFIHDWTPSPVFQFDCFSDVALRFCLRLSVIIPLPR